MKKSIKNEKNHNNSQTIKENKKNRHIFYNTNEDRSTIIFNKLNLQ